MKKSIKSSAIRNGLWTGVAALSLAAAWAAQAQDAAQGQDSTTLAPIVLQGQGEQGGTGHVDGYVAKGTQSATKTGTPIVETQQSISVVTRDQMDTQAVSTLGEAVEYVPGVVGQPFGSDARFDAPNIRGFDSGLSQYLNGLKIMRNIGAPAFEVYGLENVEVLRGPASVLYGQGNPGGMINLVSKRPTFTPINEVGAFIGSYDTYGAFFDFSGPVDDTFAYRLTGLGKLAGMQTDELDNDRLYIAPAFTWKPDEDTSLTILASYQKDNPSTPTFIPPELIIDSNTLSRDFYGGDKNFDDSDRRWFNLGYEFEHRFDDVFTFRQNARYSKFDWDYRAVLPLSLAADGRTLNRYSSVQDEDLWSINFDNQVQAEFSTGPVEHTVVAGVDVRYFHSDNTAAFNFAAPGLDIFDPDYEQPIGSVAGTQTVQNLWQTGIYLQDELKYDNWRATLGLRYDWASIETEGGSDTQRDEKLTGRAGLSYLFDNGIAPYISYATSFEPVVSTATGGPFDPTTGEQTEIGVKYKPTGFDGYFAIAAYDLTQKNVLNTVGVVTTQTGEVNVKGIELEGVATLTQGLNLRAAYTYMNAEISGRVNDGNRPANTPEHAASLWLDYTFAEDTALQGFTVGGGVRYVGSRYGTDANTIELDGNTLLDLALKYERNGYKASLNFQNLADEKYVAYCGGFGCSYGDGRTVMGKVSFTW
ncbi:iron complex outermembrane recepter protein [Rhizobium sp. NFR07]|uniref:TonB-dependent siderophore receptor n=1 Tax=Rhizobium sp. NFR07 TaxID=1566262 RepID=UPI0008EBC61A|nr:TonB-dependent siderophore receptor [Rhizobium sp. NFR07]SFB58344.1 iron complex outermembrane recepter protein [Rhizobium sp. NFR07]